MFKNKLQEFCQKHSYPLPEYETTREGPPHNPRFSTTVTVNSIPFTPPTPSRTVKLSQNDAAMLAFQHFTQQQLNPSSPFLKGLNSFPQPCFSPASSFSEIVIGSPVHNTDVDNTLPTNNVLQPILEPAWQTTQISSPVAAVSSVAAVAQISSPVAAVADVTKAQDLKSVMHLYKNQLQTFAQKRNLQLPVYASEWEGPPHAMRFRCKVTIDGKTFESPKFYYTLKDAEHAAAEVAFRSLQPTGVQEDDMMVYKNLLQEFVQKEGLQLPVYNTSISGEAHNPVFTSQVEIEGMVFTGQESKSKKQAEMSAAKVAYTTLKERKAHDGQAPDFLPNFSKANTITGLQHHSNAELPVNSGLVIQNPPNRDTVEKKPSSSGNKNSCAEVFSSSKSKAITSCSDSNNVGAETNNVSSTEVSEPPRRKKVVVYSRKTNVEIEAGGTLLPISDDKWVAYSYYH